MFDWRAEGKIYNSVYTESSGWVTQYYMYMTPLIAVKGGETYTWRISADTSSRSSRLTDITTVYYDKDLNEIGCASHGESVRYYSFTVPQNCAYIRCPTSQEESVDRESMLNVGSSPLPYEEYYAPYYDTVSYAKSISGAKTYTKFPIVLRTTEQSIPTWNVKGNEEHTGTPTPSNPVEVNGVGVRTSNLFDYNVTWWRNNINDSTNHTDTSTTRIKSDIQDISDSNSYISLKIFAPITNMRIIGIGFFGDDVTTKLPDSTTITITNTTIIQQIPTGAKHYFILLGADTGGITSDTKTALASAQICAIYGDVLPNTFIPYGYKLPISSSGVTTNIYLSEPLRKIGDYADTIAADGTVTRRIKKLVLTGEENYGSSGGNTWLMLGTLVKDFRGTADGAICSHLPLVLRSNFTTNTCAWGGGQIGDFLINIDNKNETDLKSYIAQQYANGTPVTIWYVLSTSTTETTTTSAIPTTSGINTIDVATSLKPSEMSLTYDGYKLCKRQRYSRTENLFDDHNVINVTGLGNRYGTILPNGTYSIYNGTDNTMFYGVNNWVGRFEACAPHSTATITINNIAGQIGGVFMPLDSASQGGCTVVTGSTPPDHYIPYYDWV